jgi:tripartite-type tricarboxylate transporter receptor subunit TctC
MSTPEFQKRMTDEKVVVVGSTPEQLAARVRSDYALVQKLVKETQIPLQD